MTNDETPTPPTESKEEPASKPQERQIPPANLTNLIDMLGLQAMACLGLFPDPQTGKAEVHMEQAKYLIDMMGVVEEKTCGNRTPEEISHLSRVLHETRTTYLQVSAKQKQ